MRRWNRLLLLAILFPGMALQARAQGVTVFAAASLTEAMQDASAAWHRDGHPPPVLSFGASSSLARQIAEGAPANLFASADQKWMDYLAKRGLLAAGTRTDLLSNQLVLIVPAAHPARISLSRGANLAALLGPDGRLAIADPASVPAGIYAKQALTRLGLWRGVANRLAPTEDVRGALLLVQRGEAPAGIVYATDAIAGRGVAVAASFPAGSHDPITYPFAVTSQNDTRSARALLAWLTTPQAAAIFRARGFTVLQPHPR